MRIRPAPENSSGAGSAQCPTQHLEARGRLSIARNQTQEQNHNLDRPNQFLTPEEFKRKFNTSLENVLLAPRARMEKGDTGACRINISEESWILKISDRKEKAINELLIRNVINEFFPNLLSTTEAYAVGADDHTLCLNRFSPASNNQELFNDLKMQDRIEISILALVFGVKDFNSGNILFKDDQTPVLIDFETTHHSPENYKIYKRGRELLREKYPYILSEMDPTKLDQYKAKQREWLKIVNDDSFRARLFEIVKISGGDETMAKIYYETIKRNLSNYERTLQLLTEMKSLGIPKTELNSLGWKGGINSLNFDENTSIFDTGKKLELKEGEQLLLEFASDGVLLIEYDGQSFKFLYRDNHRQVEKTRQVGCEFKIGTSADSNDVIICLKDEAGEKCPCDLNISLAANGRITFKHRQPEQTNNVRLIGVFANNL
ncbi:MAG: hypothetical protein O3C63_00050 [Cyanobacteria bacterium]|nr:hypothetical protein [Cyanobacteriota bacterium]